jgi:hypothetical protein
VKGTISEESENKDNIMDTSLEHPILGQLIFDRDLDCWGAFVWLQDKSCIDYCDDRGIDFYISVDEPDLDTQITIDRAVEYLEWARTSEPECRTRIADDLLHVYNNIWAEDDSSGQLSRENFLKKIFPESLNLNSDGSGVWYYADGNLFAGHSIEIFIEVDRSFNEAHLAG